MPRKTAKDIERDKVARFDRIKQAITALEKQRRQILKQGELAPSGAWVARYQVRQNNKKYWYYKLQAPTPCFQGPLKKNCLVDDTGGSEECKRIESLNLTSSELEHGEIIKIKTFPKDKKVQLFRVTVSTDKTEFVATNDLTQDSTDIVQEVCDIRWKIEEFHREIKQLTGIESCQCRKARIQRNHINCAMLVWTLLKQLAYSTGQTVYQLKHGLLSNYLIEQLKHPVLTMTLA
jgi:hypothetical protein